MKPSGAFFFFFFLIIPPVKEEIEGYFILSLFRTIHLKTTFFVAMKPHCLLLSVFGSQIFQRKMLSSPFPGISSSRQQPKHLDT